MILVCVAAAVLVPAAAFAQASGIAGVVRDTSGAVMPGVTVEASSPALIERVRTVTTDCAGPVQDRRPPAGHLHGHLHAHRVLDRQARRDRAAGARSPPRVNADLRVGALEETITVTGRQPGRRHPERHQAPGRGQGHHRRHADVEELVDDRRDDDRRQFSNQNDVGGSAGEHQNQLKAHGGSFNDRIVQLDGLMIANMACNYACTGLSTNDASTQELSYEFGAISAETGGGGVRVNIIPKEGGNRFSGSAFVNFANDTLQGNNVDDTLRGAGHHDRPTAS